MSVRRLLFVAALALGMVFSHTVAVWAAEFEEHLANQGTVAFSGQQSVVCNLPDGRQSDVFEVGQNADGVGVTVDSAGTTRSGRVQAATPIGPQYRIETVGTGTVLGRTVDVVEVLDRDVVRMRIAFDTATSVVMRSEILNGDGSSYCTTQLIEFSIGDAGVAAGVTVSSSATVPEPRATDSLPAQLAGFALVRMSEGPQPSVTSAFYADGLFSFTLLHSQASITVPELSRTDAVAINGHEYQRDFQLGRAAYSWNSRSGGYVLVGELPVDKQLEVLSELPAPESRNLFQRFWDGLFGG